MDASARLAEYVKDNPHQISNVVNYDPVADKLFRFDLTSANTELNAAIVSDISKFNRYIDQKMLENNCRYGIGGYMEHRTIYTGIPLFDTEDEPRRLHLGIDIWAGAGTPVYAPLSGTIHSFKDNNNHGDYGPAIILQHELDGLILYSLYGHLSRGNLTGLAVGQSILGSQQIGTFGAIHENGHWPPHLHFQLMFDMEGNFGDYPGAGRYSEKARLIQNIPDPNILLQFRS